MEPYEESIKVPVFIRIPWLKEAGRACDALTAPVDWFPTLAALAGVPIPRTMEGHDLSGAWRKHSNKTPSCS